jgi:hypothetical protein
MAGLNSRRSSPRSRPDTRMPVTPSGMSGNTSIIDSPSSLPAATTVIGSLVLDQIQ